MAGQDYNHIILLQTVVLALFPVSLYLLGKTLGGRLPGLLAALAAILREYNQLSVASLTTLSNSKLLLSELPTALGIVTVLIVLVFWLKAPQRRWPLAVLAGGLIGLIIQIRLQTILFLPFLLGFLFLYLRRQWKTGLVLSALICLGFTASLAPLVIRNWRASGTIALEKPGYLQGTLEYSYRPVEPASEDGSWNPLAKEAALGERAADFVRLTNSHFVHNTVSAFLTIASGSGTRTGWSNIEDLSNLYWLDQRTPLRWPGAISMILSLGVIALGASLLWQRRRWLGALPALFFAVYNLSSALGGFSGQRFILPVDWVGYFYFFVGFAWLVAALLAFLGLNACTRMPLFQEGFPREAHQAAGPAFTGRDRPAVMKVAVILALLTVFGALLPLEEAFFPVRYPSLNRADAIARIEHLAAETLEPEQQASIQELLDQPDVEVLHGIALYPRLFEDPNHSDGLAGPLEKVEYPLLTYLYIGSEQLRISHPSVNPDDVRLASGSEVLILGTRSEGGFQAFATVPLDQSHLIYSCAVPLAVD